MDKTKKIGTARKGEVSVRFWVGLMGLLLAFGWGPPPLLYAQTVEELVHSPPLPNVRAEGSWNYDDQFALDNVYNAIKNDDYLTADVFVKKLAREHPESLPVWQLAAHVALRLGRYQDAEQSLTEILTLEPNSLPARSRLGFVLAKLKKFDQAEAAYETVLAANPSAELRDYAEKAITQLKSDRLAADQLMTADRAKLEPRIAELKAAGRLDELTLVLDEYLGKHPYDRRALIWRGETQMGRQKYGEAQKTFAALLESYPDDQEIAARLLEVNQGLLAAEWQKVELLQAKGDLPGLEKQLDRLLALQPGHAPALIRRAAARYQMGEDHWAEARRDVVAALKAASDLSPEDRELAGSLAAKLPPVEGEELITPAESELDLAWRKVQEAEAGLRAQNDRAGLERLYTDLIAEEPGLATYAYSSRGYLLLAQNRLKEAGRDFQEALARTEDPGLKADFEAALAQVDWQTREAGLRARGDWPGVEKMYDEAIAGNPAQAHLYMGRGYARLARNHLAEAAGDFRRALALTEDPAAQAGLEEALAKTEKQSRLAEIMAGLLEKEKEYTRREDRAGLIQLYGDYIREFPESALFWALRGFARVNSGLIGEGKDDLRQALRLNPDPRLKRGINDVLAGGGPAAITAETYLARAGEQVESKNYGAARISLAQLSGYQLTGDQTGRRDFLTARILWGEEKRAEASPWFAQALVNLPRDFWASEAHARLAEYSLSQGDEGAAVRHIDQSLALAPNFVWHKIQAGNIYSRLKQNEKALDFYREALADPSLRPEDVYFYRPMALAALNLGHRDDFDRYMRRHIDWEADRLRRRPSPSDQDLYELYRLKKELTDLSQRFGGHFFIFGNSYDNGDYLSSFTGELKMLNPLPGFRNEIYVLGSGTLASSLSGYYYDPWADRDFPYTGNSHLRDTLYAAVGARYYPLPEYDFYFGVEQRFKIGREATDDTLLILNLYEALGNDWEPLTSKNDWLFASIYSQLTFSTRASDLTYSGDGRLGRSYSLDAENMLVLTPFLGAAVGYGGESVAKSERWSLEAGPGLSLKKWIQEDDPYMVPTSSVDFSLQYRFGLSHNRHDVLSATIYYSF